MFRSAASSDSSGRLADRGFTLVELLLAVTLLVMIVLVSSFIFDTTTKAVSYAQASTEMNISLGAFSRLLRKDGKSIEHDGYLVLGARRIEAYGCPKDRTSEIKQTFRNDWMMFFINEERDASSDGKVIGQWFRVLYGHGKVSDPNGWLFRDQTSSHPMTINAHDSYSNVGTDWIVMRHQVGVLHELRETRDNSAALYALGQEGVDVADSPNWQFSTGGMHLRSLLSYTVRDFRWHCWNSGQWDGSVEVNYGPMGGTWGLPGGIAIAIYEPYYYHYMARRNRDFRRLYTLAHCASFQIQFAMPEDLTAGPGGTARWRDPPRPDDNSYPDPNYSPARPGDPLHPTSVVPANTQHRYVCPQCGRAVLCARADVRRTCPVCDLVATRGIYLQYDRVVSPRGRLVFGPGDRWPVLLKVTVWVFDPLDRLDGGKKLVAVVPVP